LTLPRPHDGPSADLDPAAAADLIATAGDLAVVLDATGVVRAVVTADAELRDAGLDRWVGQPWGQTVTPETRGKIDALMRDAGARPPLRRRQVNHRLPDGSDLPISYALVRVGREGQFLAAGRDMRSVSALQQRLVEAQQAMERDYWKLRHVETRYRLLFQLAVEAIVVVDAATSRVVDANAAAGRLFAEPPEKLVGRGFPFGIAPDDLQPLGDALANARAVGRSSDVKVHLAPGGEPYVVAASTFRQEASTLLLVRFLPGTDGADAAPTERTQLARLIHDSPDAIVITDLAGHVRYANRAFVDLVQLPSEEQARGEELGAWIGRPGADFDVFVSMLRKHGAVRLALTAARGQHGLHTEVEVSASWLPDGEPPAVAFVLRDVGRRLAGAPQGARDLTRAVEELTGLVGRVSLRELVRDTTDLVERHFIEAALELTDDNRTSAAEVLGVSRQSLYVKLRRHQLIDSGDTSASNADSD
jgi:transcriptional regulator PpsR